MMMILIKHFILKMLMKDTENSTLVQDEIDEAILCTVRVPQHIVKLIDQLRKAGTPYEAPRQGILLHLIELGIQQEAISHGK